MKSKLAIFSFILSLIIVLPIILFYLLPISERIPGFNVITTFLLYSFVIFIFLINFGILIALSVLTIILAIVSLKRIKKYGLAGRGYAWMALVISSFVFLYSLYLFLIGGISFSPMF